MAAKSLIFLKTRLCREMGQPSRMPKRIKGLSAAAAACPQSYPQDLWTVAKALFNH
jgi:hypothetical protein